MSDPLTPESIAEQVAADWDGDESVKAACLRAAQLCAQQSSARIEILEASCAAMREALERIQEGKGDYSLDPFQHASNTIDAMKELARDALANPAGSELLERLAEAHLASTNKVINEIAEVTRTRTAERDTAIAENAALRRDLEATGRVVLARDDTIAALRGKVEKLMTKIACAWTVDEDNGSYDTTCNRKFVLTDGTPEGNEYFFCPGCGNAVEVLTRKELGEP